MEPTLDVCPFGPGQQHRWNTIGRCVHCSFVAPDRNTQFRHRLESLLNGYSQENESNTPDFILAEFLLATLKAWNEAVTKREKWYGREKAAGGVGGLSPVASPAVSPSELNEDD